MGDNLFESHQLNVETMCVWLRDQRESKGKYTKGQKKKSKDKTVEEHILMAKRKKKKTEKN